MTPSDYWPGSQQTPWREYLDREHRARSMYLSVTATAHREYLTGPFPDRDAYLVVERDAYATYYQAGREAWRIYRATVEGPPPPPPPAAPIHVPESVAGAGWPASPYDHPQPTFKPNPEGDQ